MHLVIKESSQGCFESASQKASFLHYRQVGLQSVFNKMLVRMGANGLEGKVVMRLTRL